MSFTNGQLAQKIADLIGYWSGFNEEYANWLGGAVGGGTNSDGRYPLTDWQGITYLVECPAQLSDNVNSLVSGAQAFADAASASATAAAASASAAATDEGLADAARIAAEAAQVAAEAAKVAAENAETNAIAQRNVAETKASEASASASAASASEAAAASSETNAAASEAAASQSAIDAANSAAIIANSLYFAGVWDASGGSAPTSPSGGTGYPFYKITVAGTISSISYAVGDSIVWDGSGWFKIDNTEQVTAVAGYTGAVTAAQLASALSSETFSTVTSGAVTVNGTLKIDGFSGSVDWDIYSSSVNQLFLTQGGTGGPEFAFIGDGADHTNAQFVVGGEPLTATNVQNFKTAYGWGNHAGLYLPIGGGTLTGDLAIGDNFNMVSAGNANYGGFMSTAYAVDMFKVGALDSTTGNNLGAQIVFDDYGQGISFRVGRTTPTESLDLNKDGNAYFAGNVSAIQMVADNFQVSEGSVDLNRDSTNYVRARVAGRHLYFGVTHSDGTLYYPLQLDADDEIRLANKAGAVRATINLASGAFDLGGSDLTVDRLNGKGFFAAETLASFDAPGGTGSDVSTTAAFAMNSGHVIAGYTNGYIRTLLGWTSGGDIKIGQSGTSLIGGIELLPGSSGTARVNGNVIWDAGDFSSTDIANWNTAFGWGNHASAGYATLSGANVFTNVLNTFQNELRLTRYGNTHLSYEAAGKYYNYMTYGSTGLHYWRTYDGTTHVNRAWLDGSGNFTLTGNLTVQGNYLYNSLGYNAIRMTDSWLRLNQDKSFASGVYTPGNVRIDDALQVGTSTTNGFYCNGSDGSTLEYKGAPIIRHANGAFTGGDITVSTSGPTGGADGDIWLEY